MVFLMLPPISRPALSFIITVQVIPTLINTSEASVRQSAPDALRHAEPGECRIDRREELRAVAIVVLIGAASLCRARFLAAQEPRPSAGSRRCGRL